MHPFVALVLAYLFGSIPTAFIVGKVFGGIDLRRHGSGNLGATNVLRVMGWKYAVPVFIVDIAKGALPVFFLAWWTPVGSKGVWVVAYGVAAILGHVLPVFLKWRGGGKGVATATGVFLALAAVPTLVAMGLFILVVYFSGYVSLASLSAALALPTAMLLRDGVSSPVFVASALVCVFVFWTHRANIARLRRGEENRLGRKPSG